MRCSPLASGAVYLSGGNPSNTSSSMWCCLAACPVVLVVAVLGMSSPCGPIVCFACIIGSALLIIYCIAAACGWGSKMPRARVAWYVIFGTLGVVLLTTAILCSMNLITIPNAILGPWALWNTSAANVIPSTAVTGMSAVLSRSRLASGILRTCAPAIQAHLSTRVNPMILNTLAMIAWTAVLGGLISHECGTLIWDVLCGTRESIVPSMPTAAEALATSIEDLAQTAP